MTTALVLAVDVGTSAVKVGLFDELGQLWGSGSHGQQIATSTSGAREEAHAAVWDSLKAAVSSALQGAHLGGRRLRAVAVTGPRGSFALVDRHHDLSNFVAWQDQRGASVIGSLAQKLRPDRYERLTGMGYLATAVLPKLIWMQSNDKRRLSLAVAITTPQSYVLQRLGAEENFIEPSVAAHTGLLELRRRAWSDEIRRSFNLDSLDLPRLVETNHIVGRTSSTTERELGIPANVPLVIAGSDGICSEIGLGVTSPGQVYAYLGTASALAGPMSRRHPRQALRQRGLIRMPGRAAPWDRIVGLGGAGGSAVEWATHALGIQRVDALEEIAAGSAPGAGGLLFMPTLAGASSPVPAPTARGCFLGLSLGHRRTDMARAVLEGVALELRCMLEVARPSGLSPVEVRLCGGGTRSAIWRQIIADVLQLRILSTPGPDAGLRGAAISGFSTMGVGSVEDLAEQWSRGLVETVPSLDLALRYDMLTSNYQKARAALARGHLDEALFETAVFLSQERVPSAGA